MKLAAIDIGSNAARLLISEVVENSNEKPVFLKINLIRVPLRLGFDVFDTGSISEAKEQMLLQTIKAYKHLLNAYNVKHVIACATSAMRDAKNAKEIIQKVKKETQLDIDVISGDFEATLIYENHIADKMNRDHSYLYIDVGGGSTELTFFTEGRMAFKKSFNIGTIRILKNMVSDQSWDDLKDYIKSNIKEGKKTISIGSGGNINKVFSLSKRKEGKPLSIETLRDYHKELSNVTVQERIMLYNLREDRADVIVPALFIYINIMKWADSIEIYVPKIGLADGLIQHLYRHLQKNKTIPL